MFAFALHDARHQRVVLARDHFGIKPLYYAVRDGALYFGSEIKAILAGLGQPARTSSGAVQEYLMFRCCTGERSFFDGIHRLPPGSVAVWEGGRLTVRSYWMPPAPRASTIRSLDEAATELEAHLEASVRSQLMSEVPLGTFCSGGVDSGLTSTYAARASSHTAADVFRGLQRSRLGRVRAGARHRTARRLRAPRPASPTPRPFTMPCPGSFGTTTSRLRIPTRSSSPC